MREKKNMRAVVITAFGGPERLAVREMLIPTPGPDEVLIRVQAAGVGLWDVKVRRGQAGARSLPFVPGWESAGVIERLGASVTGFTVGDAVYCYVREVGHYAEYITVPAGLVALRPRSLAAAWAASSPICGLTAHQSITDELGLRAGETVLITAAAGGVGTFAVQIAAQLGVHVIATASARNHQYLRNLGAHEVIDYTTTEVVQAVRASHPAGVDAVLDCLGGQNTATCLGALRDEGRLAFLAEAEALPLSRGITAHIVYGRPDAQRLTTLAHLVDAERLMVHLERAVPLEAAREAHELVEAGHVRGKIVLSIGETSAQF